MLLGQVFVAPGDEVVMGSQTFPIYKTSTQTWAESRLKSLSARIPRY